VTVESGSGVGSKPASRLLLRAPWSRGPWSEAAAVLLLRRMLRAAVRRGGSEDAAVAACAVELDWNRAAVWSRAAACNRRRSVGESC
jgi:hypothetical protein